MNHSAAYISPRPIGFYAMVRLPSDAEAHAITKWCPREKKQMPIRFDDAYSAQKAATERVLSYFNGNMRRDGVTLLSARSEAEAVFQKARA